MIPLLDLEAPIIPGRGFAGLEIGRHISQYEDLLSIAEHQEELDCDDGEGRGWTCVRSLWEASFRLRQVYDWSDEEDDRSQAALSERRRRSESGDELTDLWAPETPDRGPPAIEIGVDIRDGVVFALRALEGYEGPLLGTVRTGVSGKEALEAEPRLRYRDADGGLVIEGVRGVLLALEFEGSFGHDLSPDQVGSAVVEEIWIFDPDRTTSGVLPHR